VKRVGLALGALLGAMLGLILLAGPVAAHAVLEDSDPRADAVVATLPDEVTLSFSESVSLVPGSLRVYGPDGTRVDRGDVEHRAHDDEIGVSLDSGSEEADRGTYLVSWRVISADSHPVSGAFTFSVGAPSAAPMVPAETSSRPLGIALGVARWVGYLGSALLVGGLLVIGWCWRAGWSSPRARRLMLVGGVLLAVGAVGDLLLKGPYDAALGLGATFRGDLLGEVLGTTYGHASVARLVLALLGLILVRRRVRSLRTAAALAVLVGISFALAGHAAAGEGHVLAAVNDTVHVIAASTWLGGLVLLLVAVLPSARAASTTDEVGQVGEVDEAARIAVTRFSGLALGAVVLLAGTGLFQAIRQVGSLGAVTGTPYGRELLVKLGLVLLAVLLAVLSRRALAHRGRVLPLRLTLARVVALETVLLLAVLGVTSALVATEPAKAAYHPITSASLTLVGQAVDVTAVPAGDRAVEVHVYVLDPGGQPATPKELTASASLPAKGIDALPVPLRLSDPGHWQGELSVPAAGEWRLAVTVRTTAIDEATGYVTVRIR